MSLYLVFLSLPKLRIALIFLFFFRFHSLLFFFFSSLLFSAWAHNTPFILFHMYASVSQKHERERERERASEGEPQNKRKRKMLEEKRHTKRKGYEDQLHSISDERYYYYYYFVLFSTLHPFIPFQCGCFSVFLTFFFFCSCWREKKKKSCLTSRFCVLFYLFISELKSKQFCFFFFFFFGCCCCCCCSSSSFGHLKKKKRVFDVTFV